MLNYNISIVLFYRIFNKNVINNSKNLNNLKMSRTHQINSFKKRNPITSPVRTPILKDFDS